MFRKIIFVIAASLIFLPNIALMADLRIPEFNPLCWKQKACQDQRQTLSPTRDPAEGWVKDSIDCPGDDWGKCLPAGVATTQIAFGGQKKFLHIGDFIQSMYKYAVGVAGVVAVTMIIIAGLQWVTSGGNSEAITSAKKRISGALTGLFIAYAAYFILNTINPALVNLRLPQVYMIRPQNLIPRFCSQAPDDIKNRPNAFALAKDKDKQLEAAKPDKDTKFDKTYKGGEKDFGCGKRFFMDSGGTTCWGNYCDAGNVCVNFGGGDSANPNKYYCAQGILAGRISGSMGGIVNPTGIIINNGVFEHGMELFALCRDGSIKSVGKTDARGDGGRQAYIFKDEGVASSCGDKDKIVGFYIGAAGNDGGLGKDDWFAVGREPGTGICDVNLSDRAFSLLDSSAQAAANNDPFARACSFLTADPKLPSYLAKQANFANYLISPDELTNGFICDIVMTRSSFPSIDNSAVIPKSWTEALLNLPADIASLGGTAVFRGIFDDKTTCFAN